jgi:phosphatidylglycerophosphatase A
LVQLIEQDPELRRVALRTPAGFFAFGFGSGVYLCGAASRLLGRHDPGNIVWDEMVGFWLTVALLPMTWSWWLAGFAAFRLFDILKPWPIRWLDQRVPGGFGIMLDDAVAAVYALLILAALQRLL